MFRKRNKILYRFATLFMNTIVEMGTRTMLVYQSLLVAKQNSGTPVVENRKRI